MDSVFTYNLIKKPGFYGFSVVLFGKKSFFWFDTPEKRNQFYINNLTYGW